MEREKEEAGERESERELSNLYLDAGCSAFTLKSVFCQQIVQGVGVGFVTKKFTESSTLVTSSFILVWSYLLLVSLMLCECSDPVKVSVWVL